MTSKTNTDAVETLKVDIPVEHGELQAVLCQPKASGAYPALVIGTEAWGVTEFVVGVGRRLAMEGFVCVIPDFLRGAGLSEDQHDLDRVVPLIDQLDFRRATDDLFAAATYVRSLPNVETSRVGTWGYCTGGTLSLLLACLSRELSAAVLFYPSQPVFSSLDARRPVHPIDLLWNVKCPMLMMYGDQDPFMPPDLLDDVRRRIDTWGVDCTITLYGGAGHTFNSHFVGRSGIDSYRKGADEESWATALRFAKTHLM